MNFKSLFFLSILVTVVGCKTPITHSELQSNGTTQEVSQVSEYVKAAVNKALEIVQTEKDPEKLKAMLDNEIYIYFDFELMSRSAVGRKWRRFGMEQKHKFQNLFGTMMKGLFFDKMEQLAGAEKPEILFKKEVRRSAQLVEVETEAIAGSNKVKISYRLVERAGKWKVYDIVVSGVSMISNYRSQFRRILGQRSGINTLIKTLDCKVNRDLPEMEEKCK